MYNNILTSGDNDRQGVFSQAPRLYIETRSTRRERKKKKETLENRLSYITNCLDMTRREGLYPLHLSKEVDPSTNRCQFFNAYDVMLKSPERQSFSLPLVTDCRLQISHSSCMCICLYEYISHPIPWRIDAWMHDICYAGKKKRKTWQCCLFLRALLIGQCPAIQVSYTRI